MQNLLVLRFANAIFEPLWNQPLHRPRADHRGRDDRRRGPRRLLRRQPARCATWCRTTCCSCSASSPWSRPASLDADAVRDEKLKVLRALRPITADDVAPSTVRGQYRAGAIDGEAVPGYHEEEGVADDSQHRDLRRAEGRDRQLALGRRAVLPAHRQAPARARFRKS